MTDATTGPAAGESLDGLLDASRTPAYDTEPAYIAAWRSLASEYADASPFALAVRAGLHADRFAWIFAGGYQSAMRHVFADLPAGPQPAWRAFAVSEDRDDPVARPGVTYTRDGDDFRIEGYKTWIAGAASLDEIVFKAGRGPEARYFCVSRSLPGLTLTLKPAPRVLPDLSQGVARFEDAHVGADAQVTGEAKAFAATEVLYIYTSFLASVWLRADEERAAAHELLALAQRISTQRIITREGDMHTLDAGVQHLLARLSDVRYASDARWQRDAGLVRMYSRQ